MNQPIDLLLQLIKKNGYPIDKGELELQFNSDPSKSLQAFSNSCDHFGISNTSLLLPKEALDKLPQYFIAEIKNKNHQRLLLIHKNKSGQLTYSKGSGKFQPITKDNFLNEWSGVVFAIEQFQGKLSLKDRLKSFKSYIVPVALFAIILGITTIRNWDISHIIVAFGIFLGWLASYHLMKHKYEQSSDSLICQLGKTTDCNQVINSKYAKIFNHIELTDACFVTLSSFIITYFIAPTTGLIALTAAIACLILPYSLYIQAVILKKWCTLCLGVAVSIILIASSSLLNNDLIHFEIIEFIGLMAGIIINIFMLNILKNNYRNKMLLYNQRLQYKTLWRSPGIMEALLNTLRKIEIPRINNKIEITIVTNPMCLGCKMLHDKVVQLESYYDNKINVSYKFLVDPNQTRKMATKASMVILGLSEKEQKQATDQWYDTTNSIVWFNQWNQASDSKKGHQQLQQHLNWCYANRINYSPVIIIDGLLVPDDYTLEQFKNVIAHIIMHREQYENNTDFQQQDSFLQDDRQVDVTLS